MAKYVGTILTNKGKELLARAVLGEVITFTKVEIGEGIIPEGTNKEDLLSPIETFKTLSITSTTALESGSYRVRIAFNNSGVLEDTYFRETGLFARGEDGIEVLYSYCDTDTPDLIPKESSGILERVEDIITYVSSAGTINAVIDQSNVYATIKDLVEGLATKEDKFDKNTAFNLTKALSRLSTSNNEVATMSLMQEIITFIKEYSDANTAGLVASAPVTLDTLNELAMALGDDPNFATTVTNLIANKQNNLGYAPVQQGTGVGQLGNVVKIGWTGAKVNLQVDAINMGDIYCNANKPTPSAIGALDKGTISTDYNTGEKIENKIKNKLSIQNQSETAVLDGVRIKTGSVSIGEDSSVVITFDTAFSSVCMYGDANIEVNKGTSGWGPNPYVCDRTKTSMKIINPAEVGTVSINWIAIGY